MHAQARYSCRNIVQTIVFSCFMQLVIYAFWSNNSTSESGDFNTIKLPCGSKQDCYEHAIRIGRTSWRTSSIKAGMSSLRNIAIRRQQIRTSGHTSIHISADDKGRGIGSDVGTGPENGKERVNAAFVVLVRNRELDDLRSSMR